MENSSAFGNGPDLIGSRGGPVPSPEYASGPLRAGDRLFLMTDALAEWFLHAHESGRRPWEAVDRLLSLERPEEAFAAWVEQLRDGDGLRDDDATLLVIEPRRVPEE